MRRGQQLRRAVKGKRNYGLLRVRRLGYAVFGDESATDGEEGALHDFLAGCVVGRKAKAVGMLRLRTGRIHHRTLEDQVARFFKCDGVGSGKIELMRGANGGDRGCNGRGIDVGRLVAGKTEQHGAIGRVA